MRAPKVRSRSRGSGGMIPWKILKKVVYSRRKIEIKRKKLSPRVDLPAQGGGGHKPPKLPPSYGPGFE